MTVHSWQVCGRRIDRWQSEGEAPTESPTESSKEELAELWTGPKHDACRNIHPSLGVRFSAMSAKPEANKCVQRGTFFYLFLLLPFFHFLHTILN